MKLKEIQDKLENDIKCELWKYCEEEKTFTEERVKETMNILLDYIDNLILERGD